ncbi:hypothetical protein BTVI_74993 [Pitangus sulphuratus]|nr:hypothetical protein BTVI_74993 [Pitangus sulphuratus]
MAAGSVWKGLVGLGLFALAHAAFSAAQHRSYMRLTEKEDETLPIDIVLQTLLAFAVTCYGIAHIAGEFKDMDATSELKNKLQGLAHPLLVSVPSQESELFESYTELFKAKHLKDFERVRDFEKDMNLGYKDLPEAGGAAVGQGVENITCCLEQVLLGTPCALHQGPDE